jgi:hypothetical protein
VASLLFRDASDQNPTGLIGSQRRRGHNLCGAQGSTAAAALLLAQDTSGQNSTGSRCAVAAIVWAKPNNILPRRRTTQIEIRAATRRLKPIESMPLELAPPRPSSR